MTLRSIPALLALAAAAIAQSPIVIPNGLASTEGASSTAYPWGRGTAQIRVQYVFDSTHFTNQGVTYPILITNLRWRANGAATGVAGTYSAMNVMMATCPVDQAAASTTFASNLGADLTTVYNGSVSVAAGAGATPNNWYVNIPLSSPFLYDPSNGDLTFDFATNAAGWVGSAGAAVDCATTGSLTSRIYNLTNFAAATGTFQANVGITTEITFTAAAGAASASTFGAGCYDRFATFLETFPASSFDLSNSSLRLTPAGSGYLVTTGSNQWWTPVGANLGMGDDTVSAALPLGFTLNYPGGSTTDVYASSNGFVWAQAGGVNGCCAGDPALLVAQGARWCPLWNDLNPSLGGTVVWDQDLVNGAAYLTYTGVQEYGQAANLNTFQVAFFSTGEVEMRWQTCAVTAHVTLAGWSPGNGARTPSSTDLSAGVPFTTAPDQLALRLAAAPRPVVGNTVVLTTSNVPAAATLGVMIYSFGAIPGGLDLGYLGMPGCKQHVGLDSTQFFFPAGGTGSLNFNVPNNPFFSGLHVYGQSAVLVSGVNARGILSSNGLDLLVGTL
jgi:hypothetical protein